MATLADVAKRANVSKMTVSRVINHPDQVSDELKMLVYSAMEALEYVPNYAARALVQNRTQVIKFLILEEIDTVEPYYMNLLTGISRELDKYYYSLQLVTQRSRNIGAYDGLIVTGIRDKDYDLGLLDIDKPVIFYGENKRGYDSIDVDNKKGTALATEHMTEIGFSRIVFLGIDLLDEQFMKSRLEGYEEVVKNMELNPKVILSLIVQVLQKKKRLNYYVIIQKKLLSYAHPTELPLEWSGLQLHLGAVLVKILL